MALNAARRQRLAQAAAQGAAIAALALLLWWFAANAVDALRARGVRAGFDFLLDPAGFQIGEGWLDFEAGQPFWRAFLAGFVNTVRVALPALALATLLGFAVGVARLARHALLRGLGTCYVELLRNVPLLVQLLMWYFTVTQLLPDAGAAAEPLPGVYLSKSGLTFPWPTWSQGGWWPSGLERPEAGAFNVSGGAAVTPEYLAVLLALATYTAAFIAETVRAGIQAVPAGQVDAARALGMQPGTQLRHVVLPQALRVIVPSLTNQYLNLTKNSTLAVAVGYPELVSVSNTVLNQTGRAFECVAVIMAVYLTISLATSAAMNRYNARVVLRGEG